MRTNMFLSIVHGSLLISNVTIDEITSKLAAAGHAGVGDSDGGGAGDSGGGGSGDSGGGGAGDSGGGGAGDSATSLRAARAGRGSSGYSSRTVAHNDLPPYSTAEGYFDCALSVGASGYSSRAVSSRATSSRAPAGATARGARRHAATARPVMRAAAK